MAAIDYETIRVGDILPALTLPPLDRTTLALFAGASGDHVPLHIDIDAARRAGMPDVFGHGMLSMAWMGRVLTAWAPQSALRGFDARFAGITHLGNAITCTGKVVDKGVQDGQRLVRVELQTTNQYGEKKTLGEALFAFA